MYVFLDQLKEYLIRQMLVWKYFTLGARTKKRFKEPEILSKYSKQSVNSVSRYFMENHMELTKVQLILG